MAQQILVLWQYIASSALSELKISHSSFCRRTDTVMQISVFCNVPANNKDKISYFPPVFFTNLHGSG